MRAALRLRGLEGMVFAAPEGLEGINVRYLTGFHGSSSFLVVGPRNAYLVTDFRYIETATAQGREGGYEVRLETGPTAARLASAAREAGTGRTGFEADRVSVALFEALRASLPEVLWQDASGLVEDIRRVKESSEIAAIRSAAVRSARAVEGILPTLPGRTERAVAADLEYRMRQLGLDGPGFPTIVASGERGSMPHAEPGDRVIAPGDLVTIDFGGLSEGYRSDETVTVAVGPVPDTLRHIFDVVADAQACGIQAVRPGIAASEVDRAARVVIEAAGFGGAFGHGTGHGVGLEIHERPFARRMPPEDMDEILLPGMTLTVEPGIYVPGLGGVRLEDTLLVTQDGSERLTVLPKTYREV